MIGSLENVKEPFEIIFKFSSSHCVIVKNSSYISYNFLDTYLQKSFSYVPGWVECSPQPHKPVQDEVFKGSEEQL